MNDDRIMNVPEELRKLMRKFGDLCFDEAPQEEIDQGANMRVSRSCIKKVNMFQNFESMLDKAKHYFLTQMILRHPACVLLGLLGLDDVPRL